MFAPLVVSFYSEIDTSKQVPVTYLAVESVGAYGFEDISGSNYVRLFLKKFDESSTFSFVSANNQSRIDTLIFLERISSAGCPCQNPDGEFVSVYKENDDTLFLCSQVKNMLFFHKEQQELMFLSEKKGEEDTLFVFRPKKDVLTVKYTNTQVFVSAECGCMTTFYLNELKPTYNNITDALITNPSVTGNYNEKHIRLYFENY